MRSLFRIIALVYFFMAYGFLEMTDYSGKGMLIVVIGAALLLVWYRKIKQKENKVL